MNILLIQSSLDKYATLIFPAGLTAIAATLNDHNVRAVDLNVVTEPEKALTELQKVFQPDIIGISFRNIDDQNRMDLHYYYRTNFQQDIQLIRSIFGNSVKLVAGGSAFSLFARQIMEENPEIDFGVYLEGEETFPLLLDNLSTPEQVKGVYYREQNIVQFSGKSRLPDFSSLPMPRLDLFNPGDYSEMIGIGIQTVRGCTNRCSYCVYPNLNGNSFRFKSPSKIADEIEEMKNRFGISKFFFTDASFGLYEKHSQEVMDEIIKREIDVEWGAYFDLNADQRFLLKAHKAGCRDFVFSPDGYSENALKGLNKNFTLNHLKNHIQMMQTSETFKRCFKFYTFMISSPGETFADYMRTLIALFMIRMKSRLKITHPVSVSISWIRIEPGTDICQRAWHQNDILHESDLLPDMGGNYERLFYVNPRMKNMETVLFAVLKTARKLKSLLTR